jgi:hypothetical protein
VTERVPELLPSGAIEQNLVGAAMLLAEGEAAGHRHAIWGRSSCSATTALRGTYLKTSATWVTLRSTFLLRGIACLGPFRTAGTGGSAIRRRE